MADLPTNMTEFEAFSDEQKNTIFCMLATVARAAQSNPASPSTATASTAPPAKAPPIALDALDDGALIQLPDDAALDPSPGHSNQRQEALAAAKPAAKPPSLAIADDPAAQAAALAAGPATCSQRLTQSQSFVSHFSLA